MPTIQILNLPTLRRSTSDTGCQAAAQQKLDGRTPAPKRIKDLVVKRTMSLTCLLCVFAGGALLEAQSSRAGDPRRLIIESMTGEDSFRFYCAPCHGVSGRGDGPVAPVLKTVPRDLTTLAKSNAGAFPRSAVTAFVTGTGRALAAHGGSDMPVWGPIFRALDPSDARVKIRIDNIVTFIESIQTQ